MARFHMTQEKEMKWAQCWPQPQGLLHIRTAVGDGPSDVTQEHFMEFSELLDSRPDVIAQMNDVLTANA